MNPKSWRYGLFAAALTGAVFTAGGNVLAAEQETELPGAGIESVITAYQASGETVPIEEYLVPSERGAHMDMGFANVDEGSFLYIRSEPAKESEWVGKLYRDHAAKLAGPVGEWTRIESGSVTGYVKTEFLLTGEAAQQKAETVEAFAYAESKEEEAQRIAKEEEERLRQEQEAAEAAAEAAQEAVQAYAASGQAVVDYACQFLGNPYVWGGTSLTNGADCSGFVQSVYADFGVGMPRTSGEMRYAGTEVSYEEAMPGDVVCYDGHVGIYMGDGKIVNAIDEAHGIGISNAGFTNIITVRRLL